MQASHKEGLLSGVRRVISQYAPQSRTDEAVVNSTGSGGERAGEGRVDVNDGHTEYSHRAGAPRV